MGSANGETKGRAEGAVWVEVVKIRMDRSERLRVCAHMLPASVHALHYGRASPNQSWNVFQDAKNMVYGSYSVIQTCSFMSVTIMPAGLHWVGLGAESASLLAELNLNQS